MKTILYTAGLDSVSPTDLFGSVVGNYRTFLVSADKFRLDAVAGLAAWTLSE